MCIFQVLDGGTDLCCSSRNVVLLLVYCFPRWSCSGFRLAFSTITALTPTGRGTNVVVLPNAEYIYSDYVYERASQVAQC